MYIYFIDTIIRRGRVVGASGISHILLGKEEQCCGGRRCGRAGDQLVDE